MNAHSLLRTTALVACTFGAALMLPGYAVGSAIAESTAADSGGPR